MVISKLKKAFAALGALLASAIVIMCITYAYGLLAYLLGDGLIPAPDYAIVYVDTANKTYIAPPCLGKRDSNSFEKSNLKDVHKLDHFYADEDCKNQEAFFQNDRSIITKLLEKTGFISPFKNRWNNDGTWNW